MLEKFTRPSLSPCDVSTGIMSVTQSWGRSPGPAPGHSPPQPAGGPDCLLALWTVLGAVRLECVRQKGSKSESLSVPPSAVMTSSLLTSPESIRDVPLHLPSMLWKQYFLILTSPAWPCVCQISVLGHLDVVLLQRQKRCCDTIHDSYLTEFL